MKIETIDVMCEGYVCCESGFYTAQDILQVDSSYSFVKGSNKIYGEIDSGVWAVSYLLSMYGHKSKNFSFLKQPKVVVNGSVVPLQNIVPYSCYMDRSYPLFSGNSSIKKMVVKGIRTNQLNVTPEEVRQIFGIDLERFERPLVSAGNEIFKAMAAIGYCYEKQIYCFPWLSQMRFHGYHQNLNGVIDILDSLGRIAIVPIGSEG